MKKALLNTLLFLLVIAASGCSNTDSKYEIYSFAVLGRFGSNTNVQMIYDKERISESEQLIEIKEGVTDVLDRLDNLFNVQERDNFTVVTDLMKVNNNAGVEPVIVDEEVILVLKEAIRLANESEIDGKAIYDPTIGPLWKAWDFINKGYDFLDPNYYNPLSDDIINSMLPNVDYNKIVIDEDNNTVFLEEKQMGLDLGSIVKGYAADEIKKYLISKGINRAVIDVAGNVQMLGLNFVYDKDKKEYLDINWNVGIKTPYYYLYDDDEYLIGHLVSGEATVVTSGVYEKYIMDSNKNQYHHILDPRTGKPFNNGVVSTTVITNKSITADGLSTMLFGLGLEKGMQYINSHEGLEAIYVMYANDTYQVFISSGLKETFTFNESLLDKNYIYEGEYNG